MDLNGTLVEFMVMIRLRLLTSQTTKSLLDSKLHHTLGVQLTMLSGSSLPHKDFDLIEFLINLNLFVNAILFDPLLI